MPRNPSQPERNIEPPETDDLKLIYGIGPAVEQRLHGVGVYTFAQLAALSPADIAASVSDLAGLTAERILKQDWIGQARRLAEKSAATEPPETDLLQGIEIPTDPQYEPDLIPAASEEAGETTMAFPQAATFSIELRFDEHQNVLSTHVAHAQSGIRESWDGWQEKQLVNFLVEHAGIPLSLNEPAASDMVELEPIPAVTGDESELTAPGVEEVGLAIVQAVMEHQSLAPALTNLPQVPPVEPIEPVAPLKRLGGVLHLRDLEMLEAGSKGDQNILFSRQPFEVQLTLDLTEVVIPEDAPLTWTASIYGKTLDRRSRLLAGQAQGTFQPTDTVSIKVQGNVLPQGIYRLEAIVTLTQTVSGREVHPGLIAQLEERLLQFC